MQSYEQGYDIDRFENDVSQNYHCPICLNVFKQPVMCQRNQHLFCLPCITRHLTNSQTCPSCIEELTLETLTPAPRILTGCMSELNIRCDYFNRGCRELVQLGLLKRHVKDCGFTPVVCSNEGCLVEINKRDRTHHETEVCEFRVVKCHNCAEMAKEMDDVKMKLTAVNDKLERLEEMDEVNKMSLKAMNDKIQEMDELNKTNVATVNNNMAEIKMNLMEIKEQLTTLPDQTVDQTLRGIQTEQEKMMKRIEEAETDDGSTKSNVVIAGGWNGEGLNSVEMFSLSTKSWTVLHPMKKCRSMASTFIYKNQITVNGGATDDGLSDSMESLSINPIMESAQWFGFPAKLSSELRGHCSVVYNGRLLEIGGYDGKFSDSIHEVSLDPPYTSKFLTRMPEPKVYAGVELFNDRAFIVGGSATFSAKDSVDSVLMYDINKNECKEMAPLPFTVSLMATVSWGDNVIVIGGVDKDGNALNTVVIYNVQSEKSHMLPAMKYKRTGCTAVVTGNAIVVMGGRDGQGHRFRSVESFSFDRYSWEELPPMNDVRVWATAVAW